MELLCRSHAETLQGDMTEPPPSLRLPFLLSVASGFADRWPALLVPIDVDRAKRTAERITGLCDYGDDGGFGRRLHATVESLKDTEWNLIGRVAVRTSLRWHLINRLNLVELLKRSSRAPSDRGRSSDRHRGPLSNRHHVSTQHHGGGSQHASGRYIGARLSRGSDPRLAG